MLSLKHFDKTIISRPIVWMRDDLQAQNAYKNKFEHKNPLR